MLNSAAAKLHLNYISKKIVCRPNSIFLYPAIEILQEKMYFGMLKNYSQTSYPRHNFPVVVTKNKSKLLICDDHSKTSGRHIWGWLNSIFNRVDENRILDAGPDRACAEWLLRCGAGVKWHNSGSWTKDYNSLPIGGARLMKIEEVDATDSAIMHIGFPHFKNCKYIRRLVMHKATYVDDEALSQLYYLKKSLRELQISSCGNVSKEGLKYIKTLGNLEYLLLYDLPLIRNKEEVVRELQEALPNCTILFPYALPSEIPEKKEVA